jgi:hypothetical protein
MDASPLTTDKKEKSSNPAEIASVPPNALPEGKRLDAKERTRQRIAYVVIAAYIVLVIMNLVLPMLLYFSYWPPKDPLTIADIKDLMIAISGVLSGFVSILGFIVGYYFKAAEEIVRQQKENELPQN